MRTPGPKRYLSRESGTSNGRSEKNGDWLITTSSCLKLLAVSKNANDIITLDA
jgi:hypothetical protein